MTPLFNAMKYVQGGHGAYGHQCLVQVTDPWGGAFTFSWKMPLGRGSTYLLMAEVLWLKNNLAGKYDVCKVFGLTFGEALAQWTDSVAPNHPCGMRFGCMQGWEPPRCLQLLPSYLWD